MIATCVDPRRVPQRTLYTGAHMPAIGLGTFGSDHVSAARDRRGRARRRWPSGYRHIDCAAVYGNEREIGARAASRSAPAASPREELWITSKLWNDKHAEADVIPTCRQSLADLRLDYLDLYLIHWPFPNFHAPGVDVQSRAPTPSPTSTTNYMHTWRAAGEAGRPGPGAPHRHLQHDHPQAEAAAARRPHQARRSTRWSCTRTSSSRSCSSSCAPTACEPIGYCPIGSPDRPERDRTPEDTVDIEDPVIVAIAERLGVHPAVVCVKWAVQRGQMPIPMSTKRSNYLANLRGGRGRAAHRGGHGGHRRHRPQLPPDQGPGLPVEGRPELGRSVGRGRGDHAAVSELGLNVVTFCVAMISVSPYYSMSRRDAGSEKSKETSL